MTETPNYLSLTQAAKETGKSKGTIFKYLKDGTLSYVDKDSRGYKIDPAELFRVFPKNQKNRFKNVKNKQTRTNDETFENLLIIKELETELNAEIEKKDFYKQQYEKIEQERDDWKKQAQTLLLQSPAEKSTEKPIEGQKDFSGTFEHNHQKKASIGQNFGIYGLFIMLIIITSLLTWYFHELF